VKKFDDVYFATRLKQGRRLRRFYNQVLTFLAFLAPGGNARVRLNRLKGVKIGDECWIGDNVTLDIHYAHPDAMNSLIISDRVTVGPGAKIFTHDTAFAHITKGLHPVRFGKVSIGSDTWIGANAVISNCSIGKCCIIAPNSLVTQDIPDYSLVRGNPASVELDLAPVIRRAEAAVRRSAEN
jgi:acetyltransferase-like isoleucine patch superfamily enzyme